MKKLQALSAALVALTLTACGGGSASDAPLEALASYYHETSDIEPQAKQQLQQALEGNEVATIVEAPDEAPFELVKPFTVAVDLNDDLHDPSVRLEAVLRITDGDAFQSDHKATVYGIDDEGNYTRLGRLEADDDADEGEELTVACFLTQHVSDYNEIAAEDSTWMALVAATQQAVIVWSGLSQSGDISRQAKAHYNIAKLGYDPEALQDQIKEEVAQSTPDVRFFQLHGRVKHFATTVDGYEAETATFDEAGNLLQYLQGGMPMLVSRDAQGRINAAEQAEPEDPDWAPYYSYRWDDFGFVSTIIVGTAVGTNTTTLYTDRVTGDVSGDETRMETDFDGTEYVRNIYEIDERDAHGNWTRRTITEQRGSYQKTVETRTIEYF